MAVTDSRLKNGVLTLGDAASDGPVSFHCQATNVIIASDYSSDGDALEVLCGDQILPSTTVAKTLKITAIQDFDNPAGFQRYCREHELQLVPFLWQANPAAEIAAGQVELRLGDWGGDVAKRLTTAPEMPITPGSLEWTPPLATGATAGSPGTWTPPGSTPPPNLTVLQASSIVASPVTAWTSGQRMILGDATQAHWDGDSWVTGAAP